MSKNKPYTLHKAYNVYKNTVQSSDVQSSRRHLIKIKWIVLLHTNQVNINTSLYYIERYDKKMSIKKHTHKHIYTTCTTWNFFFHSVGEYSTHAQATDEPHQGDACLSYECKLWIVMSMFCCVCCLYAFVCMFSFFVCAVFSLQY